MQSRIFLSVLLILILAACVPAAVEPTATPPAPTGTATLPPTVTPSPSATPLPTATFTPAPTATPVLVFQKGEVVCPILLYHRIAQPPGDDLASRYYVSPEAFRTQMQALHDWGYTTIPLAQLVQAINFGAELPPRPLVITFDDGDITVYEQAFPIMREYGFTGVFYLVDKYLAEDGFVNEAQVQEMAAAGWEVGSHSMTHVDLRANHDLLQVEGRQSQLVLEQRLGLPVETFAYPFGGFDEYIGEKIRKYGYSAAVGLGTSARHSQGTLFYLSRIEVRNAYTLDELRARLPWSSP